MTALEQQLIEEQERNEKREQELYESYMANLKRIRDEYSKHNEILHDQLEKERREHLARLKEISESIKNGPEITLSKESTIQLKTLQRTLSLLQETLTTLSLDSGSESPELRRISETLEKIWREL